MTRTLVLVFVVACTSHTAPPVDRTGCNDCHATEYDTAPQMVTVCKPTDHEANHYAHTCSDCHGTAAWCPADANHFQFDIKSESHAGWDCADCHPSISYNPPRLDVMPIDCTNCHFHDKARTDSIHLGKGGYSYTPDSCLMCHLPGGRG